MKTLTSYELLHVLGGSSSSAMDCAHLLQYEAATHQSSGNEEWEDDYWDDWGRRFEECAKTGKVS